MVFSWAVYNLLKSYQDLRRSNREWSSSWYVEFIISISSCHSFLSRGPINDAWSGFVLLLYFVFAKTWILGSDLTLCLRYDSYFIPPRWLNCFDLVWHVLALVCFTDHISFDTYNSFQAPAIGISPNMNKGISQVCAVPTFLRSMDEWIPLDSSLNPNLCNKKFEEDCLMCCWKYLLWHYYLLPQVNN